MKTLTEVAKKSNPDSELDVATKRLLLSAHLGLVWKKLRQGLSVEEKEILALIPFTVSNGSRGEAKKPSEDKAATWSDKDADWARRVANAGALR